MNQRGQTYLPFSYIFYYIFGAQLNRSYNTFLFRKGSISIFSPVNSERRKREKGFWAKKQIFRQEKMLIWNLACKKTVNSSDDPFFRPDSTKAKETS